MKSMFSRGLASLTATAAILLLSACAALTGANQAATNAASGVLQLATVVAVQSNCSATPTQTLSQCYYKRAQTITNIVGTLVGAATATSATLPQVQAAADTAVLNAPVQDRESLKILLNKATLAINQQIGSSAGTGLLSVTQQAIIQAVAAQITAVSNDYPAS